MTVCWQTPREVWLHSWGTRNSPVSQSSVANFSWILLLENLAYFKWFLSLSSYNHGTLGYEVLRVWLTQLQELSPQHPWKWVIPTALEGFTFQRMGCSLPLPTVSSLLPSGNHWSLMSLLPSPGQRHIIVGRFSFLMPATGEYSTGNFGFSVQD